MRVVIDHARAGIHFARMAIVWPSDRPYARLVEHHLDAAGLPWNGRPGTLVTERLVPRFLLDLLDVDRRGLRRSDLFDLLADIPTRGEDGQVVRLARWERVGREAGVNRARALAASARQVRGGRSGPGRNETPMPRAAAERHAEAADELAEFVAALQRDLGHPMATRSWSDWADWCERQIAWRLGTRLLSRLDEAERLAHDHTTRVLDRLRHLDAIGPPVRRSQFRAVFAAEFEVAPGRLGRIGTGVTIGSLSGAVGLDSDLVIVLGAADGLLPPAPSIDPLVTDADRRAAGLPTSGARAIRAHRNFLAVLDSADEVVIGVPRGDLRSTTERQPSRWLAAHVADADWQIVGSHHAGLIATEFPAADPEHRLRHRSAVATVDPGLIGAACGDDQIALRAIDDAGSQAQHPTDRVRRRPQRTYDRALRTAGLTVATRGVGEVSTCLLRAVSVGRAPPRRPVRRPRPLADRTRQRRARHARPLQPRDARRGTCRNPGPRGGSRVHSTRLIALYDEVADEFERTGRTGRAAHWCLDRRSPC